MALDEKQLTNTLNPGQKNKPQPPVILNRQQKKVEFTKRFNAIRAEGLLWWPAGIALSKWIDPLRGSFEAYPTKRAMLPDYSVILNNHATQARGTMASGLSSGMTSQSMPWLRLTMDNLDQFSTPEIRKWLDDCQKILYGMLDKSNIYSCINNAYEELAQFGTACFIVLEDYDDVVRGRDFTFGQYFLGTDNKGRVNTFGREFWMQVGQVVKNFGFENCSPQVQQLWNTNYVDNWIKIRHLIEPNDTRMPQMADFKNMPIRSVYWDVADGTETFLACRGFKKFPIIAPRWKTNTTDQTYGYGPGWYALGNTRQLQKTNLDKLLAQEKSQNPPMQADANVDGHVSTIPGGLTRTSSNNVPNAGVRPAYQVQYDANSFIESMQDIKDQIDKDFFVNLFMMLINGDNTNMTATEVAERQQEKIMMMGPILYKLQTELLDPLVELLFHIAEENNLLPPPPQEIAGMAIKVQYISILAQAQKSLGVQQINRIIAFIQTVNEATNNTVPIADGFDFDEALREVIEMEGAPAKLNVPEGQIDQIRADRAKQAQQQQAAALAEQTSKAVKNFLGSPTDTANAMTAVVGQKGAAQPAGAGK